MAFDAEKIRANREYFAHKLQFEKQRNDVLHAVQGDPPFDFVLLDTRGKGPFAEGHIPGAWCVTIDELDQVVSQLPKDKEIVTYCWGHD
jgi:rhodanese-related sulfurtransferase